MNNIYDVELFEKELDTHKRKIARAMMRYEKWLEDNELTKDAALDDFIHIYKCREVIAKIK